MAILKVRYSVLNGEVIAENRGGVRKQYYPDALGSTVLMTDSTQAITDTFDYWPGGQVKSRTGSTPTNLTFVGTQGYYSDTTSRYYVRARHFRADQWKWTSMDPDPISSDTWNLFAYAGNSPISSVDPSGLVRLDVVPKSLYYGDCGPVITLDRSACCCGAYKAKWVPTISAARGAPCTGVFAQRVEIEQWGSNCLGASKPTEDCSYVEIVPHVVRKGAYTANRAADTFSWGGDVSGCRECGLLESGEWKFICLRDIPFRNGNLYPAGFQPNSSLPCGSSGTFPSVRDHVPKWFMHNSDPPDGVHLVSSYYTCCQTTIPHARHYGYDLECKTHVSPNSGGAAMGQCPPDAAYLN